jgi:hypothetical protein
LAAVGTALVLTLTLAGCWSGSHRPPASPTGSTTQAPGTTAPTSQPSDTNMDTIAAQIQAALAERPDVAAAEVKYADNLTSTATAHVNITVKAGAALEPVLNEAVRLVWLSKLNPLHNIAVSLIDEVNKQRGETAT